MEKIKKTIQRIMTTGTTTCTGCTGMCTFHTTNSRYYVKYGCTRDNIVPDLDVVYNIKIGLEFIAKDIGFFDAMPKISYYYSSGDGSIGVGEVLLLEDNYI